MGAQHRPNQGDPLVDHLPQPIREAQYARDARVIGPLRCDIRVEERRMANSSRQALSQRRPIGAPRR